MVADAEKSGPQLSSTNDPRITKVGRFMRKTRLLIGCQYSIVQYKIEYMSINIDKNCFVKVLSTPCNIIIIT